MSALLKTHTGYLPLATMEPDHDAPEAILAAAKGQARPAPDAKVLPVDSNGSTALHWAAFLGACVNLFVLF